MPDDPNVGQSTGQAGDAAAVVDSNGVAQNAGQQPQQPESKQPSWFDNLPAGLKGEKSLEAFKGKDIAAVAESYVNAQKLIGGSIRVPGKDATPEEKAKFEATLRTHMGVPESADKYTITPPDLPEGVQWDTEQEKSFKTFAHNIGLSNAQVQKLVEYDAQRQAASLPNPREAMENAYTSLRDGDEITPGWGAATDRNLALAKRTVEVMFPQGMMEHLVKTGVANDPNFIRGIVAIGRELKEDGLVVPEDTVTTDQDIQAEIDKIENDAKGPLYDKSHPLHQKTVERKRQLYQMLYNK